MLAIRPQIAEAEKAVNGPRVILGDVAVVAHAPAGEPRPQWGQWQFPSIERLADGRLHVTWSITVDSARSYGAQPAHAVSADEGRTWTRVAYPEADHLCTGVLLANGDRLRLASDPPLSPDKITLPDPITNAVAAFSKQTASGDYRFFRQEDFSGEMRKGYPQFRMAAGSSSWVKEYPKANLPGQVIWQREGILVRPFFMGNLRAASDGSLWTSCYWPSLKDGTVRAYCPAFVQSTDNGYSWNFVSEIPFEPDKSKHSNWERCWGFCEPDLAYAPDGSLLALLRAGPSYIARSTDNGKHWDKPVIFDSFGVLPQLLALKSRVMLASYGRSGVRGAYGLIGSVRNEVGRAGRCVTAQRC
ncbi:MAG: glycoside hydrolase [Planctomycetaceae bacterium]|nr:glycoside hydrolase [Planctomycetaceae bacterium]